METELPLCITLEVLEIFLQILEVHFYLPVQRVLQMMDLQVALDFLEHDHLLVELIIILQKMMQLPFLLQTWVAHLDLKLQVLIT